MSVPSVSLKRPCSFLSTCFLELLPSTRAEQMLASLLIPEGKNGDRRNRAAPDTVA